VNARGQRQDHSCKHKQPCGKAHLPFQRPSGHAGSNNWQTGFYPCRCAAFKDAQLFAAWLKQSCHHAGPLAALADQHDRIFDLQVWKPGLHLIHGHVHGAGNVAGGILGWRTDVDQLKPLRSGL